MALPSALPTMQHASNKLDRGSIAGVVVYRERLSVALYLMSINIHYIYYICALKHKVPAGLQLGVCADVQTS